MPITQARLHTITTAADLWRGEALGLRAGIEQIIKQTATTLSPEAFAGVLSDLLDLYPNPAREYDTSIDFEKHLYKQTKHSNDKNRVRMQLRNGTPIPDHDMPVFEALQPNYNRMSRTVRVPGHKYFTPSEPLDLTGTGAEPPEGADMQAPEGPTEGPTPDKAIGQPLSKAEIEKAIYQAEASRLALSRATPTESWTPPPSHPMDPRTAWLAAGNKEPEALDLEDLPDDAQGPIVGPDTGA